MIARRDELVRVASRRELSPSCFRLVLETERPVEAVPGQFGMLACAEGLDPLLRRAFSLAGVGERDGRGTVELLLKRVGRGTRLLASCAVGTRLRLLAPLGNGFTLGGPGEEPCALVAGGIGLPPLLFAAEAMVARGARFDLLLGAATADELLEVERCRAAVAAVGGELVLSTDDGSRGEPGFVTTALERRLDAGRAYRRVLACGPTPMLAGLTRLARERGFVAELSLEQPMACGVGVCLGCVVELSDGSYVPTCKEGPVFSAERLAERWAR